MPGRISRPSYADTGIPPGRLGAIVHPPERIEAMREACKIARDVLDTVLEAVREGITTDELDYIAHERTITLGAYPSPLNYGGYPKSLCTSVNDVVCHGIPGDRVLMGGDIINCDVTAYYGGVHGDCSETVYVGVPDAAARRLVETTWLCLQAGIAAVQPGYPVRMIGQAIAPIAHRAGYGVVEAFAGHGIATHFHMDPTVPHYDDPAATTVMRPGMLFTIEPMLNEGGPGCSVLEDGWTAVTLDGGRSAQFEHTILVTEDGAEALTAGDGPPWFQRPT